MPVLLCSIALWLAFCSAPEPVAALSNHVARCRYYSRSVSSSGSATQLSALKNPFGKEDKATFKPSSLHKDGLTPKDVAADEEASFATTSASNEKMQATVAALKNQLQRQKEEVEMTETLLERLEGHGRNTFSSRNDKHLTSIATSLVSGVDYGFLSRSEGAKVSDISGKLGIGPPSNLWKLGTEQFMRNVRAMQGEYDDENVVELNPEQKALRKRLNRLTLNSTAIWEAETMDGPIQAPWIIKAPYLIICWLLDVVFEGKYVPSRFFLLETVARMPYFS